MTAPEPIHPHRKQLRRRESGSTRFITFSCYRRLPLLGHPGIRDLFAETLADAKRRHGFQLHAWVVMPEHVHLILCPAPGSTWETISLSLKTSVARRVLARWRTLNAPVLGQLSTNTGEARYWQHGGGFDRDIRETPELLREITYTHHNPVRRGLVRAPEEWKWSSVHWWMGARESEPVCDPPPGDAKAWNAWRGYK